MFDFDGDFISTIGTVTTVDECASICRDIFAYPYASIGQYLK